MCRWKFIKLFYFLDNYESTVIFTSQVVLLLIKRYIIFLSIRSLPYISNFTTNCTESLTGHVIVLPWYGFNHYISMHIHTYTYTYMWKECSRGAYVHTVKRMRHGETTKKENENLAAIQPIETFQRFHGKFPFEKGVLTRHSLCV